jgi:hypothetical protein
VGLGTAIGPTCDLWDIYADEAAKHGYQAGSENFGYLIPTFIAETEEKAQELGKGFIYGGGQTAFSRPEHTLPPGYNSKSAIRMLAKQPGGSWLGVSQAKLHMAQEDPEAAEHEYQEVRRKLSESYKKAQKGLQIIVGTPKTVIPKVKTLLQVLRPGIFIFFHIQGPVSNADRMTSMRLMADEVVPVLRDYAKELGLADPYERTPGDARAVAIEGALAAVADGNAGLAILNLAIPNDVSIIHQVALSGDAVAVAVADGLAYVGLANGRVAVVEMASGQSFETVLLGVNSLSDVLITGDVLYVLAARTLFAFPLDQGALQPASSVVSPGSSESDLRRLRLSGGGDLLYAANGTGFNVFSLADRLAPRPHPARAQCLGRCPSPRP